MKYLKKFETFHEFKILHEAETEIDGHKVVATFAAPSNTSGGVQIDSLTITVNGEEYQFEIGTLISGDIFVYPNFSEGELYDHFNLKQDEAMEDSELTQFLSQNDDNCIGDEIEIDGFDIKIIDFTHLGGVEEGYVTALIDGEEYQFFITQDATHSKTQTYVECDDEEKAKLNGIEITDELKDFLAFEYDRICTNSR